MGKKTTIISLLTVSVIGLSAAGALTYFLVLKDPIKDNTSPTNEKPIEVDKKESEILKSSSFEFNTKKELVNKIESMRKSLLSQDKNKIKESINDLVSSINNKIGKVTDIYLWETDLKEDFYNQEKFYVKYYTNNDKNPNNEVNLEFINNDIKLLNEKYFNKNFNFDQVFKLNKNVEKVVQNLNDLAGNQIVVQEKPNKLRDVISLIPDLKQLFVDNVDDKSLEKLQYQYMNLSIQESNQIQDLLTQPSFSFLIKLNESYKELKFSYKYIDYINDTFNKSSEPGNQTIEEKDISNTGTNIIKKNYMLFVSDEDYKNINSQYDELQKNSNNTQDEEYKFLFNSILNNSDFRPYESKIINQLSSVLSLREEVKDNWKLNISKNTKYLDTSSDDGKVPEIINKHLLSWLEFSFENISTSKLVKHPKINLQVLLVDNKVDLSNPDLIEIGVFEKFKKIDWDNKFTDSFNELGSYEIEKDKYIPVFNYSFANKEEFNKKYDSANQTLKINDQKKYEVNSFIYKDSEYNNLDETKYIQYIKTKDDKYIQINLENNSIFAPLHNSYDLSFTSIEDRKILKILSDRNINSINTFLNSVLGKNTDTQLGLSNSINVSDSDLDLTFFPVNDNVFSISVSYKKGTKELEQSKNIRFNYKKESFLEYLYPEDSISKPESQTIYLPLNQIEYYKKDFLENNTSINDNDLLDFIQEHDIRKSFKIIKSFDVLSYNDLVSEIPNKDLSDINNKFSFTYFSSASLFKSYKVKFNLVFVNKDLDELKQENQFFTSEWYYENDIDYIKDNVGIKNIKYKSNDLDELFNKDTHKWTIDDINNLINDSKFKLNNNMSENFLLEFNSDKVNYDAKNFNISVKHKKDGIETYVFRYEFNNEDYLYFEDVFDNNPLEDKKINIEFNNTNLPKIIEYIKKENKNEIKETIASIAGFDIKQFPDNEITYSNQKDRLINLKIKRNLLSKNIILKLDFNTIYLLNSQFQNTSELITFNDNITAFDSLDSSSSSLLNEYNNLVNEKDKIDLDIVTKISNIYKDLIFIKNDNQVTITFKDINDKEYKLILKANITKLNPKFEDSLEIIDFNDDISTFDTLSDTSETKEIIETYNNLVKPENKIDLEEYEKNTNLIKDLNFIKNDNQVTITFKDINDKEYKLILKANITKLNPKFEDSLEMEVEVEYAQKVESLNDETPGQDILSIYNEIVPKEYRLNFSSYEEFQISFSKPTIQKIENYWEISFSSKSITSKIYKIKISDNSTKNPLSEIFSNVPSNINEIYNKENKTISIDYYLDQDTEKDKQKSINEILDLFTVGQDVYSWKPEWNDRDITLDIISSKINELLRSGFQLIDNKDVVVLKSLRIDEAPIQWQEKELFFSGSYDIADAYFMRLSDIYTSWNKPTLILKYKSSTTSKEEVILLEFNNIYVNKAFDFYEISMNKYPANTSNYNVADKSSIFKDLVRYNNSKQNDLFNQTLNQIEKEIYLDKKDIKLTSQDFINKIDDKESFNISIETKYIDDDESKDIESVTIIYTYHGFNITFINEIS